MALTAARTVSVATADCATTSRDSASVRPASADAGSHFARISAQTFVLLLLLKIGQTMAGSFWGGGL